MSATALPAFREVALAQARTLARAGRHAEALELLDGAWDEDERSAAVLDLMARIHAQQGRFEEADRCWAGAEELAPGDPGAVAGRRRLAAIRDGGRGASGGPVARALTARFALSAGAALVTLLAFAMLADLWLDGGGPAAGVTQVVPAPPAAAAPPSVSAAPPSPTAGAALAGLRPEGPGVRVQRRSGEIGVTFERGLFRSAATLSPSGRAALEDLGARLRPYGDRITVEIIGHTDRRAMRPGGEYGSNVELGTVRAAVVREVLRTAARMPTARFSVSTLAGMMAPYPDGAAGRARNRTVSLRISPAAGR